MAPRVRALALLIAAASVLPAGCNNGCPLGVHGRVSANGAVAPGGGSFFRDFPLAPQHGDMQISLVSTAFPTEPGLVDAFLTSTSCSKLFDGPYPGSSPLCPVLIGPVPAGKVSPMVPLDAGTYRLWVQGYTSNTSTLHYLIDIDIWDVSCRAPLQ